MSKHTVLAAALGAALGAALALSGLTATALGQTAPGPMAPQTSGRFTMHPADGGMLRLDTETGTMSMCKAQAGGQWACQSLPDERAALDKELSRLAEENKELQAAVKRLEDLNGIPSDRPKTDRRAESPKLPTPQDVDKAMDYLQSMLKKFREKLKDFEGQDGKRTERL